jgi:hypothetical protein
MEISKGQHGGTSLDGLRFVGIFRWPGPIHLGKGEAGLVIDERATPDQRQALLRILTGQDTEPGATIFQVFSTTLEKLHEPMFLPIDFEVDVDGRRGRLKVDGVTEGRGEPIKNPVTGAESRARIDLPNGFEFTQAEVASGTGKATGEIKLDFANTHAHLANYHWSTHGVVR